MKDEELILKAVEYCNDIPARVKDFLRETTPPTKGEEPKPMFKVGQWVTDDYYKEVIRFGYTEKDGRVYDTNGYLRNVGVKYLRPATPEEIESHLIKIAKEKGFVLGITINHPNYKTDYKIRSTDGYDYSDFYDHMSLGGILIYQRGIWANIIPAKQESKPMFKVPGWYWHVERQIIFYAISESKFYLQSKDDEYIKQNCIHPKPAEIESHLRKICDDKYIGKKTKGTFYPNEILLVDHYNTYNKDEDRLWYYDKYGNAVSVYESGKFAEIIPEKKKLPNDRKGISELIELYHYQNDGLPFKTPIDEFLQDYED